MPASIGPADHRQTHEIYLRIQLGYRHLTYSLRIPTKYDMLRTLVIKALKSIAQQGEIDRAGVSGHQVRHWPER